MPATAPDDHDDPIVIDNERIRIFRKKLNKEPKRLGNDQQWSVHPMADLTHLVVKSVAEDHSPGELGPEPIGGVKTVTFDLVKNREKNASSFSVHLKPIQTKPGHNDTIVQSTQELSFVSKDKMVTDKYKDLHIAQIRYTTGAGETKICLAETGKPQKKPEGCQNWGKPPREVHIFLCANPDCVARHP